MTATPRIREVLRNRDVRNRDVRNRDGPHVGDRPRRVAAAGMLRRASPAVEAEGAGHRDPLYTGRVPRPSSRVTVSQRFPSRPARAPLLELAIQWQVDPSALPRRRTLRRWVLAALERPAEVTLRFVGAREGRALNHRYRGRDDPTNVLTFVYDGQASLSGDIVLCAPVVRREARAQGRRLVAHYAHLVIHGMLHLQGYDHQRAGDAARMEARESELLVRLGYADPWRGAR